jgi:WD40 repeat protein
LLHNPLQHSAPLEAAIFSPDGRRVATYGAGHLVRIFDVKTGLLVSSLEHPVNALPVTGAAFSPGGDLIATSRGNVARLWDVETGVPRITYQPHTGTVTDVAFSPTGEQLVTASSDTIARIWTTATGALVTTTSGHTGLGINDVDFSPDKEAQAIVSAGTDGTLRYSAPGQNSIPLLGHESAVLGASFGTDGRSILSASADGTARLWDPYGEPVPKTLKTYSSDVTTVAVDPTGSRIAVGRDDGGVEVLSPGRRVISTPVTGIRRTVSVGWAGETTLMAATSAGRVRIWGDSGRGSVREFLHGSGIRAAAISRDGKQVATAGQDRVVRLWRLSSGTSRTLEHDAAVTAVAFDETGQLLASASGKQAFVWRTSDAERFRTLDPGAEADDVTGVAFGGHGRLATLDRGGKARIWSFRSEKLVNTLIRHGGAIGGLSFSPDGRWLVTAGLRKAGVWQVGDSDLEGHFLFFVAPPRRQQGNLTSVVFSRNRRIVMGSTRVEGVPYGAIRSYRCQLCGRLPELVGIARGKLAHLEAEARR